MTLGVTNGTQTLLKNLRLEENKLRSIYIARVGVMRMGSL